MRPQANAHPQAPQAPHSGGTFDAHDVGQSLGLTGWMGWRLRVLAALALALCVGLFMFMRWLAETPQLAQLPPQASLQTTATTLAQRPAVGVAPRWQANENQRKVELAWQRTVHAALAQGSLEVRLADGARQKLTPQARGLAGLGAWFWPLVALALLLALLGAVVVLAQPHPSNALFALIAWAQAAGLVQQAALSMPGALLPPLLLVLDLPLRGCLDLLSMAAVLHGLVLLPRRRAHWRRWALGAWLAAVSGVVLAVALPWHWVVLHITLLGMAGAACWASWASWAGFGASDRRGTPQGAVHLQTQRMVIGGALGLLLVSTLAAAAAAWPGWLTQALVLAIPLWLLLVSALLLAPLVLRSQQLMREFALLASLSVVAASLDLLFVAVFSLSAFTSLALVVFIALGLYAALRQWMFERLAGGTALTTERIFEQLYRAARAVQSEPETVHLQLAQVLRQLFEPLEVLHSSRPVGAARVAGAGGTLLVPVPSLAEAMASTGKTDQVPRTSPALARRTATLVLRHARRGQRIFTHEDARLADRIVEQLRRAVVYDLAVERGRDEERQRIAQDLHDDIGARLLTLMYQAPNAEMEDYVRHTLKDLKTLTRGLAAGEHWLSHAMAEWRADIDQRCAAARVELDWAVQIDHDVKLGMVAWSGLTRVLRELVNNVLSHAGGTRLTVRLRQLNGEFSLIVSDNGQGTAPETWSAGLGLGGVRKRVKLLGGSVAWKAEQPRGIRCEVRVPGLGAPAS